MTERALKRWQRSHGLVADGIAGPNTRAAMGLGPGPVLKRKSGAKRAAHRSRGGQSRGGGGVRALQRRIGVPADEAFRDVDLRAKLEALRVSLKSARDTAGDLIARGAGLSFGFNAMDGD